MFTRCIAAKFIREIINEPKRLALSSPIFPLERLIKRILPSFIISSKSKDEVRCPTILRIVEEDKKRPTLFWIGATASVCRRGLVIIWVYSFFQNSLRTGSFIL